MQNKETPLHTAVCAGKLGMVKMLVDAGANLNVKDKVGHSYDWTEPPQ